MDFHDVESRLALVFQKRVHIDFKVRIDLRDEKLLGKKIGMYARDLLLILYDIEREFGMKVPDRYIIDGYFDTYNHIIDIIIESTSHAKI